MHIEAGNEGTFNEQEPEKDGDRSARARNGAGREFQRRGASTEKARD